MAAVLVEEESLPGDRLRALLAQPDGARPPKTEQARQEALATDDPVALPEGEGRRQRPAAVVPPRRRSEVPAEGGVAAQVAENGEGLI
jgi:hypothetical protein